MEVFIGAIRPLYKENHPLWKEKPKRKDDSTKEKIENVSIKVKPKEKK